MAYKGEKYQPSGFLSPNTVIYFLGATVAGIGVAWVYDLLARWIPIIYLNAIICAGFGGVLGFFGVMAVTKGQCRNRPLALVLALVLAGVPLASSYYFGYRAAIASMVDDYAKEHPGVPMPTAREVRQTVPFKEYIDARVQSGWRIKSSNVNGVAVYVVWAIEAVIVFGITLLLVFGQVGEPFCERCRTWNQSKALSFNGVGRSTVEPLVDSGDLGKVIGLALPPEPEVGSATTLTLKHCTTCTDAGYLTVEVVTTTTRKGKSESATVALAKDATLRSDQSKAFHDRLASIIKSAAAAPPAGPVAPVSPA